ncbi:MAG: GTPase/DUF3482 domain-containing protein, partial [Candidatus Competibacterales bacterium]|nr:GTPase/DUF3482 domain-containing protein [Candidatus Competibacterales bacterium]
MTATIQVAVVGHTNTGKTSLLRTLTRDAGFGAIANRPSTTRRVEGAALLVHGQPLIAFYDTPGLEDSIGLLEHLERLREETGDDDWVSLLEHFLGRGEAQDVFAQEAKSLRQVVACDIVLYVIDVRERVLGKYRDELTLLIRTAKPVIPLLNFVESDDARTEQWRDYLVRTGLHASLSFNPLVIDAAAERRLFEKMRALNDTLYEPLGTVIEDLAQQRARLRRIAADLIADLLLDVAAHDPDASGPDRDLAATVRTRELDCARELLRLFGFRSGDYEPDTLLFDAASIEAYPLNLAELGQIGRQGGGGAAAGATAGLAVDAALGGLSLGVGTATGAVAGALLGAREQGPRLWRRLRGQSERRITDDTLYRLGARQLTLASALLRRGHADPQPVRLDRARTEQIHDRLRQNPPAPLLRARLKPRWSRLDTGQGGADGGREEARTQLAGLLEE